MPIAFFSRATASRTLKHFVEVFTGLCLLILSMNLYAEGVFCGAKDQFRLLNTTPVHQMDTKELLESADNIRNTKVSAEHRFLNHQWLLDPYNMRNSNSKILSEIFWKGLSFDKVSPEPYKLIDDSQEAMLGNGLITDFNTLKIRVSETSVLFNFNRNF